MIDMKVFAAAIFAFLLIACPAFAAELPSYTDRYVNDFAGVLNAGQISGLRLLLSELEQNTTAQVVVITVGNLSGMAPSQYATELAAQWGIGRSDVDNGLLILYAKQENKIFAATGYGMEGMLPDSKIGRLLDDYYVPQRDSGNAAQGIVDFTQAAADVISSGGGSEWDSSSGLPEPQFPAILIFVFIAAVFLIIAALSIRAMSVKCDKCGAKMKLIRTEPPAWGSTSYTYVYRCPKGHEKRIKRSYLVAGAAGGFAGGGFGGGFGGGGGGFGGGGFGGGGAGR